MSEDRLQNHQRHVPALDGIRGIAILGTVAIHVCNLNLLPDPPPRYLSIFHVAQFGWMGVDLFLVLSGFLITGILLDTKGSANYFRSFYARRTLRIFPLYYGTLLVLLALSPLRHHGWGSLLFPDRSEWLPHFFYLQNWFQPSHPTANAAGIAPLWTLAIEEQFYLVWPLVVYLLPRRAIIGICGLVCVVVPAWRIAGMLHHPPATFLLMRTFARVDTLAWGAFGALLVRSPTALRRARPALPWVLGAATAALLIIDFPLHELYTRGVYTQGIGFTVIAIGSAALLLLAYISDGERGRLAHTLSWGWLRSLGRYSYGMYVLQNLVLMPATYYLPRYAWFGKSLAIGLPVAVGILIACWALAWCSFHLYERRFLHFKKYFQASQSRPAVEPAADSSTVGG